VPPLRARWPGGPGSGSDCVNSHRTGPTKAERGPFPDGYDRPGRFGQNAGMTVAILMGSSSDASIMDDAVQTLRSFGVPVEIRVLSAHRTPDDTMAFARGAAGSGVKVIIAAAGGAAHLAGVVAAATPLPVIGVPVALANLGGLDSLLAMVQMPKGIPVATVAVNGARNAALLAVRIMALSDPRLAAELDRFTLDLADQVRDMDAEIVAKYRVD
jgi:5-(carboxyamino)imidazole ribonucleotide mutase